MLKAKEVTVSISTEDQNVALYKNELSSKYIKRFMDILLALIGIVLASPIFLVISCFYCFGYNKGKILFKQERVGLNGERFIIYKFRSMVINSEELLSKNKKLYRKYLKNNYKLEPEEDPRITSFGRFLRKTSLDELPQLFNVFKGDMSFVGPRPVVLEELEEYGDKKHLFLSVKPGLTGYWQISGRSDIGYPERVDLELYYVYNHNLLFDIVILIKTVKSVVLRKGAF